MTRRIRRLCSRAVGTLYVVATPIGNLGDLSPRARDVLGGVTLDRRRRYASHAATAAVFGIETPLTSLHEHNEARKSDELIERLLARRCRSRSSRMPARR